MLHQALRPRIDLGQTFGHLYPGNMHDQRVECGPALGAIDGGHRILSIGARGKAIDRLGRQSD